MNLTSRIKNAWRGLRQRWGTMAMKQRLWNREFSEGRWRCLENTASDCIYPYIEKYCCNGSILDLGCGSGNTGNELNYNAYSKYTGVDISDVALGEAARRTQQNKRNAKNSYYQSDISVYLPTQSYDVILFRESIFYIPSSKLGDTLTRYSVFLNESGVLIVRICDRVDYGWVIDLIERDFEILERCSPGNSNAILVVFKRKGGLRVC